MNYSKEGIIRTFSFLLVIALIAFAGYSAVLAQTEEEEGAEMEMAEENVVEVGLTEFEINMPTSLPAGPTTFEVTNNGTVEHNFEIEGQDLEQEFESNLSPGSTESMQVDLQPGTYEVYCPVGNHADIGMMMELTVTEAQTETMETTEAQTETMETTEAQTETMTTEEGAAQAQPPIYEQSPWWPYLSAHIENESPPEIVGGPIELRITQSSGGANWTFPGPRELDPNIFGTVDNPKATEVPPIILGAPMEIRDTITGGNFVTNVPTPFGDNFANIRGTLDLRLVDVTAVDAAVTNDEVEMIATFQAPEGQGTYRVEVNEVSPHGWYIPTGGGVMTNFMQHGVTRWGTQLMPTLFSYASFWGTGDIYLNDELIDEGRLVHGMLTEYVRENPYDLVWDSGVNPNARHFHLIVPPLTPQGEDSPVTTNFQLPNGEQQPFFHVMFPNIDVLSGEEAAAAAPVGTPPEATAEAEAEDDPNARVIEVTARNYEFEPSTIELTAGEPVRFVVNSEDIFHTFTIKESETAEEILFNLDIYADEPPAEGMFTPQETGSLYLYCKPHEGLGMTGTIEVAE